MLDVSSVITLLAADAGSAEEGHAGESEEEHAEHAEEGDSHEGHDHGPNDPHFWHDPLRMADLGDAIAARLGELSPEHAEEFTSAAATVREELEQLDAELTSAFEEVADERRTFITSHAAYTYLADRYDLHQVGISGIDPETEPSPQRLLALETVVRDEEVTTIFFEATASPKVAQTLADNLGIDSAELDNLETQQSPEADYPAVMRSNCTALAESWA